MVGEIRPEFLFDPFYVRGLDLFPIVRILSKEAIIAFDVRAEINDAFRKQKVAVRQIREALGGVNQTTVIRLQQARDLPADLRDELLQSAGESYPKGYESLLENYYRKLSESEK